MLMLTMATQVGTGIVTRDMLPLFEIVAPAMLVPTLWGTRLHTGISDVRFRRIVLRLPTVSGVALPGSSVPALLRAVPGQSARSVDCAAWRTNLVTNAALRRAQKWQAASCRRTAEV